MFRKVGEKNMYDIIVVGAGHAGCEAAHISAFMGKKTALITINKENIAEKGGRINQSQCNQTPTY